MTGTKESQTTRTKRAKETREEPRREGKERRRSVYPAEPGMNLEFF